MPGTGGRDRSRCNWAYRPAVVVAVGVFTVRQRPVVVRKRQTLGQDDVAGITRGIPIPLEAVGKAIDERTRRGVTVIVESWVVGVEG